MASRLFGFLQQVPVNRNGLVLAEAGLLRDPFLHRVHYDPVPVLLRPEGLVCQECDVLAEETGLFRVFAATDPKPDVCLKFANRHGLLGNARLQFYGPKAILGILWEHAGHFNDMYRSELAVHPVENWRLPDGQWVAVEPVELWEVAILTMRHLVTLWDLARMNDRNGLAQWVKLARNGIAFTLPWDWWPQALVFWKDIEALGIQRNDDPIKPTLYFLQQFLDGLLRLQTAASVVWDRSARRIMMQVVPDNLWGAMCLQLAQAIDGNKDYRRCTACSRWFELMPGLNRANRRTCSDSCRTQAYRLRRRHAVEMHAAGQTARTIARELGTKVEMVKKWLKQQGEAHGEKPTRT